MQLADLDNKIVEVIFCHVYTGWYTSLTVIEAKGTAQIDFPCWK